MNTDDEELAKSRSLYTVHHLDKAIKSKPKYADALSQDERQTAKSRWDDLKAKIMWESKHYRDLDNLKNFRLDIAHEENVDLIKLNEFIEKASFGQDTAHRKMICKDFLAMLKTIDDLSHV